MATLVSLPQDNQREKRTWQRHAPCSPPDMSPSWHAAWTKIPSRSVIWAALDTQFRSLVAPWQGIQQRCPGSLLRLRWRDWPSRSRWRQRSGGWRGSDSGKCRTGGHIARISTSSVRIQWPINKYYFKPFCCILHWDKPCKRQHRPCGRRRKKQWHSNNPPIKMQINNAIPFRTCQGFPFWWHPAFYAHCCSLRHLRQEQK